MSQRVNFFSSLQKQTVESTATDSATANIPTTATTAPVATKEKDTTTRVIDISKIKKTKKSMPPTSHPQETTTPRDPIGNVITASLSIQTTEHASADGGPSENIATPSRSESRRTSVATTVTSHSRTPTVDHSTDPDVFGASKQRPTPRHDSISSAQPRRKSGLFGGPVPPSTTTSLAQPSSAHGSRRISMPMGISAEVNGSRTSGASAASEIVELSDDDIAVQAIIAARPRHSNVSTHHPQHDKDDLRRSRSTYEIEDQQNRIESERSAKRAKMEPLDDTYMPRSSPDSQDFHQPTGASARLRPGAVFPHLPPPSDQSHSQGSLQGAPHGQHFLVDALSEDFELYARNQWRKAETLREQWLKCSLEEWQEGGKELSTKFEGLINMVRDGMTSKMLAFSGIDTQITEHTKKLAERDESLKHEKQMLVQETGKVVTKPL